jgi:hypothetical protein
VVGVAPLSSASSHTPARTRRVVVTCQCRGRGSIIVPQCATAHEGCGPRLEERSSGGAPTPMQDSPARGEGTRRTGRRPSRRSGRRPSRSDTGGCAGPAGLKRYSGPLSNPGFRRPAEGGLGRAHIRRPTTTPGRFYATRSRPPEVTAQTLGVSLWARACVFKCAWRRLRNAPECASAGA